MDIVGMLNKLYTERNSKWINELDITISPWIINDFLSMNNQIQPQVNYLDKFINYLTPKQWLTLAWCVIPKYNKTPFTKFIKKQDNEEKYHKLIIKIRKRLDMSDNDYEESKYLILNEIENNLREYCIKFGMDKQTWVDYGLDYDEIKSEGQRSGKSGLELWGL